MLLLLEILGGRNGQVLRQNGHTWVPSRTFTEIPVSVVPCELNLGGQKGFLVDFCFVQAEDVRVLLQEILFQIALGNHRPDPIHIPTRNRQAFGRVPSAILPSVSGGGHFWDLKTFAEFEFLGPLFWHRRISRHCLLLREQLCLVEFWRHRSHKNITIY